MASIARALIIEFKYLDDIRSFFPKNNAKHHQSSFQFLGVVGLRHFEHDFFPFLIFKRFARFRTVYEVFSRNQGNQGFSHSHIHRPLRRIAIHASHALRMVSREGWSVTNLCILPMTLCSAK